MGKAIAYGVDAGDGRGELGASGIPAEQIVVAGGFSPRRFHVRQAGQQAPIEFVKIGGFEKGCGVLYSGAGGVAEKGAKGFRSDFPPVVSTYDRLGSRRQSSSLKSAASRKAAAYSTAGQAALRKKVRRVSSLGSFR